MLILSQKLFKKATFLFHAQVCTLFKVGSYTPRIISSSKDIAASVTMFLRSSKVCDFSWNTLLWIIPRKKKYRAKKRKNAKGKIAKNTHQFEWQLWYT